jgi:hypothetical protein
MRNHQKNNDRNVFFYAATKHLMDQHVSTWLIESEKTPSLTESSHFVGTNFSFQFIPSASQFVLAS